MTNAAALSLAPGAAQSITRLIEADAEVLSAQLQDLRSRLFPPSSQKELRRFGSGEAAKLIGCSDGYLRQLSLAGEGPQPEKGVAGRRLYTLSQVHQIRQMLARTKPTYLQARTGSAKIQASASTNFKR